MLCFADRLDCLRSVLDGVERNGVTRAVLVANAVSRRVAEEICGRAARDPLRYLVVESHENVGSAGGYALGLERALEEPADYLWLLDDDNCPEDRCLTRLFQTLQGAPDQGRTAVTAKGLDARSGMSASRGEVGRWPRPGSCVGFHLLNLASSRLERSARLDWTGYGGLLVPRELVRQIGLPCRQFFLYGDDLEWTARIRRVGGQILSCPQAILQELSPTWDTDRRGGHGGNLRQRILSADSDRVYYEVRNRTWIARQYFPGNLVVYGLNRMVFLIAALLVALRYRRVDRFWLIARAMRDGELGRLGRLKGSENKKLSP